MLQLNYRIKERGVSFDLTASTNPASSPNDTKPTTSKKGEQRYPEPTVGALILNGKGEMLLVRSEKWGDLYTIAGGHVELGETLVDALKREIKEEVGLDIYDIRLLMTQEAIFSRQFWKRRHYIFFDFVCRSRNDNVVVDGKEIQGFAWVEPSKALKMELDEYTRRMIERFLA
jgi:nucleoside triphosphatase